MSIPRLRFPEFSEEWEEKKIGDFITESRIKGDKGDKAKKITVKLWNKGVFAKEETINGSENTQYYIRKSGQLIYSKLDFLNCAFGIIPKRLDGYQSTIDLPCFDFKEKVNRKFILNRIIQKSFYKKFGEKADGTRKAKRIHVPTFLDMPIKLPNLEEQEKIANFLSKLDSKIEKLEKKQELWETYKKGIMQQIFSQKLRFKDENGGDFPDWKEKKLGEIANFSKGKGISKNEISVTGIECIRYGELYTIYKEEIVEVVSKTNLNKRELVFSDNNDILIPTSGETALDIAKASCVMKCGVAIGGDTTIIKTKENGVFLSYYLNSQRNIIAGLAQGVSIVHLYSNELKNLNLKIPIIGEQIKIANLLSNIEIKIRKITKELEIYREFKKGLLQQMFC